MRGLTSATAAPTVRPMPPGPHRVEALSVSRPTPARCPCCGGELRPSQVVVDLRTGMVTNAHGSVTIPGIRAVVVDALNKAPGRLLTKKRLVDIVYAEHRDGGPLTADTCIENYVCRAKLGGDGYPGIRSIGLDIKCLRHRGYFLTELGA